MKFAFNTFLIVLLLAACHSHKQAVHDQDFIINYVDLSASGDLYHIYAYNNLIIGMFYNNKFFVIDSNYTHCADIENKLNALPRVWDIKFYKNDLLLMLDKDKIIVLDSNFNRKKKVEVAFNKLRPSILFYNQDSFYVFNLKDYFLVKGNYTFTRIDSTSFYKNHSPFNLVFGSLDYSDSAYKVRACSAGEFGGNVFFQNIKSLQVYSFPTYFGDLFYYQDAYHLIQSFNCLSKYIRIKDPTKLYPVPTETERYFCCNCDSGYKEYFYKMSETERKEWGKKRGVTTYFDTNAIQTLATFLLDGNLYSLCMADSSFLILQHTDTVKLIKSIPKMDKRIKGYHSTIKVVDKQRIIVGMRGTYWKTSFGVQTQIDQMGLVVIKGRKIDIFESYNSIPVKAEQKGK